MDAQRNVRFLDLAGFATRQKSYGDNVRRLRFQDDVVLEPLFAAFNSLVTRFKARRTIKLEFDRLNRLYCLRHPIVRGLFFPGRRQMEQHLV